MCSGAGHTTCLVRGSPIRTSSDQRSVGSSPRLNAASPVLHRLLVPQHPPCALNNLATQKPPTGPRKETCGRAYKKLFTESEDARVHCAVLKQQPAIPHRSPPNPDPPQRHRVVREQGEPRTRQQPHPPGHPGETGPLS